MFILIIIIVHIRSVSVKFSDLVGKMKETRFSNHLVFFFDVFIQSNPFWRQYTCYDDLTIIRMVVLAHSKDYLQSFMWHTI